MTISGARRAANAKKPWAVMVETLEGNTLPLRYFDTEDEANDHPVKLSLWRKVWVQQRVFEPVVTRSFRLPWQVEEQSNGRFTYIRDADGHRVASLFGTTTERASAVAIMKQKGLVE